ncbi:MAG: methionine biosynthesis protein MetW [Parvularculales bacterium]
MPSRGDLELIAGIVESSSRVLDIGCGDGLLLDLLAKRRGVDGRGLEISQAGVNACVARGLSVIQGDADHDLVNYPDDTFDYVILSQTIQATHRPAEVLQQMLRIGKRAIVSFPNFGHWRVRLYLMYAGRMPVTRSLPDSWHTTANIHFCTIRDFTALCEDQRWHITQALALKSDGSRAGPVGGWANMLAPQALFVLERV